MRIKWSAKEKRYLRKHYNTKEMDALMKHFGKSKKQIQQKASKMCLTGIRVRTKRGPKPKPVTKEIMRREPKRNPRHWSNRKLPIKPFDATGKRLVRIDSKTYVYVSDTATDAQVEKILQQYRKTA